MKRIFKHHQNMRFVIARTALATAALLVMFGAQACPTEAYVGQICMTAAPYCPAGDSNGYVQPVGQELNLRNYPMLFSVIGTIYGGNGTTNFKLPDLRGRSPVGTGMGAGLKSVTLGETRGSDSIVLTQSQMPSHTHGATYKPMGAGTTVRVTIPVSSNTTSTQTVPDSTHNYLAGSRLFGADGAAIWSSTMDQVATIQGVTGTVTSAAGTVSVGATGAGLPFSALPPQMGMTYCIATQGIYPQRSN